MRKLREIMKELASLQDANNSITEEIKEFSNSSEENLRILGERKALLRDFKKNKKNIDKLKKELEAVLIGISQEKAYEEQLKSELALLSKKDFDKYYQVIVSWNPDSYKNSPSVWLKLVEMKNQLEEYFLPENKESIKIANEERHSEIDSELEEEKINSNGIPLLIGLCDQYQSYLDKVIEDRIKKTNKDFHKFLYLKKGEEKEKWHELFSNMKRTQMFANDKSLLMADMKRQRVVELKEILENGFDTDKNKLKKFQTKLKENIRHEWNDKIVDFNLSSHRDGRWFLRGVWRILAMTANRLSFGKFFKAASEGLSKGGKFVKEAETLKPPKNK